MNIGAAITAAMRAQRASDWPHVTYSEIAVFERVGGSVRMVPLTVADASSPWTGARS